MQIGIPAETLPGETRVAATPETVKKLIGLGQTVVVQAGAGKLSAITDEAYSTVGARIVNGDEAFASDIIFKVRAPQIDEIPLIKPGAAVISLFGVHHNTTLPDLASRQLNCFAMELLPRITRAQSMDVLSSQANIAGYKAVLLATQYYPKFMPMLMTAAGTVKPARVLILGVGVAGLQAIATAKRLGAVVEAFDVRPSTKEQVESLGAKFVEVPMSDEEKKANDGVYAKEMSEDYKRRQGELVAKHAAAADIVITTALIPGKPAPELIKPEVVSSMKPGSVIVDLAAEAGGNCKLTRAGEVFQTENGVTLVGTTNLAGHVAQDASSLYARNLLTFLGEMLKKDATALDINMDNEIIAKTRITGDGQVLFKAN
ncbi:NAD(P) transhydrogenase subunit alpha [Chitinivorax tropicus]|uniref:NAD(P) transhydrogenase subunit alpha part 1 n=1 Tax=Chitinivorax tropicus TaxID=714531 RepID=A0A840MRA0_9PROT|nr:Re/Si-specific NAD(P)(+) transhydrogenase subunit alpha [Chitinivorax tropicus]MBB5019955.1 NAD(P) transhydrogenase subunit alpha [Chitinivorax tropicus]